MSKNKNLTYCYNIRCGDETKDMMLALSRRLGVSYADIWRMGVELLHREKFVVGTTFTDHTSAKYEDYETSK